MLFRSVSYTNLSITKLNFLKYFKNLKYLNLCGQPYLTDLTGLENCNKLIELNASYLSITNFEPFTKLNSLKTLNLHCLNTDKRLKFTPSLSMDELSNLKLEKLNLTRCHFKDISFLNKINSLKELSLFNTNFGSLNQLNNLKNLETLVVCCSDIFELSPASFPN